MEQMEENLNNLIAIVGKEINYNTQLRDLLLQEQEILMSSDAAAIEANIKEQDYVIENIKKLEEKRKEYVVEILKNNNISEKNITFKDIIQVVDSEYSDKLYKLAEEFKSVVINIIKLNENNKYMIETGLEFLEENIKVFYGANEKELFYKKGGNKRKEKGNSFRIVDRKV